MYIVKIEDQYVASLNEEGPAATADQPGLSTAAGQERAENTDETRAYVKDKFRSAFWLIKSVEQRQKTIHKVASSIINFQRDFLDHGIEYLRPLVLRDVANDIGMHESTVSRVVTNKYMHTPQGVFEMKYFFHSGISSSYGEAVSSVTIKQRIRKIIEQEDPQEAAERLEDRQHPAARGAQAGTPHDCQVSRRAQDPSIQPTQGSVLRPRGSALSGLRSPYASRTDRTTSRHHPGHARSSKSGSSTAPAAEPTAPGLARVVLTRERSTDSSGSHAARSAERPLTPSHGRASSWRSTATTRVRSPAQKLKARDRAEARRRGAGARRRDRRPDHQPVRLSAGGLARELPVKPMSVESWPSKSTMPPRASIRNSATDAVTATSRSPGHPWSNDAGGRSVAEDGGPC